MRPDESFVNQSIRSLQTMLRVIAEADGNIPTVVPDGIYGQTTLNAVTAFQRRYALPPTGVTDQATWERIVEIYDTALIRVGEAEAIEIILEPNQVFRLGDTSAYLYVIQAMLHSLSTDYPTIDPPVESGILDNSTARALAAFQILAGLPPTGELDRVTWRYLSHHFTLHANHRANL